MKVFFYARENGPKRLAVILENEAATRKEMATELRRVRKAIKDGCANLAAMHAERLAHAGFRAAVLTGSDLRVTATDAERNGWSTPAERAEWAGVL